METNWQADIEAQRRRKDEYFDGARQSPLTPVEKQEFAGVCYYPVDPDSRYELDEFLEGNIVTVARSTRDEQHSLAWAAVSFTADGEVMPLTVYETDSSDDRLWVSFRDATSGDEMYGAGHFLDLNVDDHRTDDGTWLLDFGQVYNLPCAYSAQYECPLPPTENWLDASVRAGEKYAKKDRLGDSSYSVHGSNSQNIRTANN